MSALRLVLVWSALVGLLLVTVGASFVLTGQVSLMTCLVIALAKATLIFWFFMDLRAQGGLIRLIAIGAGAWILILLVLTFMDYFTRPALS